jgi:hypothetical protein
MEKVAAACKTAGISWGLPCSPGNIEKRYKQGALFCNLGGEFGFVMEGLKNSAKKLEQAVAATGNGEDLESTEEGVSDSKRQRKAY